MPTAVASRTIAASPREVWALVGDPYHLPRWWPRVTRVEGVHDNAFTEVLAGRAGKVVRADFSVLEATPERRAVWSQLVEGTPFENVLRSAVTQIDLTPIADGGGARTEVRIELRQELPGPWGGGGGGLLAGWIRGVTRFGGPLVRRAAAATLRQALEGLARTLGDGS